MAQPPLPADEQEHLRSVRDDLTILRQRVRLLRAAGWTLRAIGEPLSAPRSTVRSWELAPTPPSPALSARPVPRPPGTRPAPPSPGTHPVRAIRPDVPAGDALRIQQLALLARKVRGGTPASSPYRAAKAELALILSLYRDRGVSVQRLATLAGVSYRAMKVRLDDAA